jgi:FixJ family two-component response regulator
MRVGAVVLVHTVSQDGSAERRRCRASDEVTMTTKAHAIDVVPVPDVTSIVFVVDDDIGVRESLELLIGGAGWQPETFVSAEEFLSRRRARVPCCLVLDVTLPGLSGLELQKQLAERIEIPIIFIASCRDVATTVQAMKAGAVDFLTKPFNADALLHAIRDAIERSRVALRQQSEMRVLRNRCASLTAREQEVMALVVSGLLNKQVGSELGISEITVKAHRGQVMRKMKADSLPELVRIAARLGVTSAPSHRFPDQYHHGWRMLAEQPCANVLRLQRPTAAPALAEEGISPCASTSHNLSPSTSRPRKPVTRTRSHGASSKMASCAMKAEPSMAPRRFEIGTPPPGRNTTTR